MERTVLHCDCNAFFASVECLLNPALKTVPMAVAGDPEYRHGIILAKNELAKKYKISTAEAIWQAKKKCPELVIVPPHYDEYVKCSQLINEIYGNYTDLVEPFGIDESWLDVTGVTHIFGNGREIADKIRQQIKTEIGITVSVGVSFNKIFAKLGSDYKKPDATTVIDYQNYKKIVFPLPVSDLLFVGKAAVSVLDKLYIKTIGDLANSDKTLIKSLLGKSGEMIWEYANGIDSSQVCPLSEKEELKSVGNGFTFKRNLVGMDDIKLAVSFIADEVTYRMRKYGVKCSTISVTIKDQHMKTTSKQNVISTPTNLSKEVAENVLELIGNIWDVNVPIRSITIAGTDLVAANYSTRQSSIFGLEGFQTVDKYERLEQSMDKIKDKYGKYSVGKAEFLKNDVGLN